MSLQSRVWFWLTRKLNKLRIKIREQTSSSPVPAGIWGSASKLMPLHRTLCILPQPCLDLSRLVVPCRSVKAKAGKLRYFEDPELGCDIPWMVNAVGSDARGRLRFASKFSWTQALDCSVRSTLRNLRAFAL